MIRGGAFTVGELIKELRAIIIVHPEASNAVIKANTEDGVSSNHVTLRYDNKTHCLLIEGV